MKKLFFIGFLSFLCLFFFLYVFIVVPVSGDVAGCCMQRQTANAPWFKNGLNFSDCQHLKMSLDKNDQIFVEGGLVYWDQACH